MVEYRQPNDADLAFIAEHMRDEDRTEIGITHKDMTPLEVLQLSVRVSNTAFVLVNKDSTEPVCAFGVQPLHPFSDHGIVWMLGTGRIRPITLARESRRMIGKLFTPGIDVLVNTVWSEYRQCIRWMTWLGAEFKKEDGTDLVYFELRRDRAVIGGA